MKRSPMPARRTPMPRGSALRRLSVIRRRRLHHDPVWAKVRTAVWRRSGGLCEYSGQALDPANWECHHRQFRSRGGQHSAANAVALTPEWHRYVHSRGQLIAKARGFVVASTADPAAEPVALWDGRLVRLTAAGAYEAEG